MHGLELAATEGLKAIGIWHYSFEQWDAVQAEKYLDELDDGIQLLADKPELAALPPHSRKWSYGDFIAYATPGVMQMARCRRGIDCHAADVHIANTPRLARWHTCCS